MKVNAILKNNNKSDYIPETNRLIRTSAISLARKIGLKPNRSKGNSVKELWWKRKIQQSIQELSEHINILEQKKRGEAKKKEE